MARLSPANRHSSFSNRHSYPGNSSKTNHTTCSQPHIAPAFTGITKTNVLPNWTNIHGIRELSKTKLTEKRTTFEDKFKKFTDDLQRKPPTAEMQIDIKIQTMSINLTEFTPTGAAHDSLENLVEDIPQMNLEQQQRTIELVKSVAGCLEGSAYSSLLDRIQKNLNK